MQVRDVLKAKQGHVIAIEPEATVAEAIARLVQNNIGSLPIVSAEGALLGVISEATSSAASTTAAKGSPGSRWPKS